MQLLEIGPLFVSLKAVRLLGEIAKGPHAQFVQNVEIIVVVVIALSPWKILVQVLYWAIFTMKSSHSIWVIQMLTMEGLRATLIEL